MVVSIIKLLHSNIYPYRKYCCVATFSINKIWLHSDFINSFLVKIHAVSSLLELHFLCFHLISQCIGELSHPSMELLVWYLRRLLWIKRYFIGDRALHVKGSLVLEIREMSVQTVLCYVHRPVWKPPIEILSARIQDSLWKLFPLDFLGGSLPKLLRVFHGLCKGPVVSRRVRPILLLRQESHIYIKQFN